MAVLVALAVFFARLGRGKSTASVNDWFALRPCLQFDPAFGRARELLTLGAPLSCALLYESKEDVAKGLPPTRIYLVKGWHSAAVWRRDLDDEGHLNWLPSHAAVPVSLTPKLPRDACTNDFVRDLGKDASVVKRLGTLRTCQTLYIYDGTPTDNPAYALYLLTGTRGRARAFGVWGFWSGPQANWDVLYDDGTRAHVHTGTTIW